jgi:LPS O-antigen subunit length determinant protein (WzzB/FepE family)
MTNDFLRDQAIRESERNIAYLNEQATKTDLLGARQAIFTILQSEINKVMMARGNDEYALKVLDPAFAPELASSPKLALWLAIGFVGGLILAIFAVIVRNEWRNG